MVIKKGDIVRSLSGRDRERYFYVIDSDGGKLKIADGMIRRIDAPKTKKIKHVCYVSTPGTRISEKLNSDEKVYDAEIRKSLRQLGFCEEYDGYIRSEEKP